jgi:hypothetical protein
VPPHYLLLLVIQRICVRIGSRFAPERRSREFAYRCQSRTCFSASRGVAMNLEAGGTKWQSIRDKAFCFTLESILRIHCKSWSCTVTRTTFPVQSFGRARAWLTEGSGSSPSPTKRGRKGKEGNRKLTRRIDGCLDGDGGRDGSRGPDGVTIYHPAAIRRVGSGISSPWHQHSARATVKVHGK